MKKILCGLLFLLIVTLSWASTGTANQSQTVTFTVVSDGTPPLTYQWKKAGVNIAGATAAIFVIPNVVAADAGTYTCAVSNPAGSATSDNAVLSVLVKPTTAGTTTTITVTTPVGTVTILSKQPRS